MRRQDRIVAEPRGEGPPWWCATCDSWRHTMPCGRDDCPKPSDPSPLSAPQQTQERTTMEATNAQAPANAAPFVDTPLKAAIREAFDNPTIANIKRVAELAALGPGQETAPREEARDYKALYHELLFAVGNKYPGESRHQTALRYLREREAPAGSALGHAGSVPPSQT
jgi:hypothetical protein